MYIYNCSYTYVEYTYICIYVPNESIEDLNDSKTLLSFWLRSLNCVYHEIPATSCGRLIEIETTYDPDRTGIKTRTYHRDPDYTNAEQEPYTNTQPYDNRPNYGAGSLRLSPSNSHQHQHYDQPPYGQQHQNQYQQQRPQPQPSQQQYENPQQADGFQQRDLPLYNRNAHVRHSPSARQTERTERRRESARSEVENTLTDYNSGCPPQHTGPVPYPYDCRRFVNCWHGRGHIQSCGPGTVFNPETLECDRPDKVVCSNPNVNGALRDERRETQATVQSAPQQNKYRAGRLIDASTDNVNALCPQGLTGLAPHPNDCTKFLNCANGNTHVQDCGPGTAFSATKKVCDFKENVDCSGRENAAYGTLNTRDGRQHANLYNVDKNIDYENSVSKDEIEGDIFCPPSVSGHFPYPFDYTKFINCKNGKTAIQNCLPGTVYSISKNYCEPEENVPHIDRVAYIVSEVRYEYSVTIVSCPPSTDGLHLYPYDFMKHISCRQGHMWIITCPANTVFSITGKSCRPESLVSVGDRVRSAWELQYSSEYSESRSAALNSLDETFVCPYGQSGLYPHPFDCRKYLKCLNGQLSVETCRQGEVFSLSSKHCDPKELVGVKEQVPAQFDVGQISTSESSYGYSATSNEGSIQLICPPHVNAFFLHPFDCTKYLYCRDGQGEVESCNSGKVFSISRRECVNRNQVDAYDRVEYESEVSHEFSTELEPSTNHAYEPNCAAGANSLYPHPTDSTKYIKCVGGQATIEHCIPGMIFSKIRKYCDYESRVQEYDSEAGNGYNVLGGTDEDGAATVTFSGGKSSTVSHRTNVECPPNSAGMHPHPYDCHKFLQCDNGVTHIKECGPGTAWSVEMEVCDFGKNVNCSGRIGSRTTSSGIHVDQKVACPANVEGFYLHPFNGYQYIECKNGGETQVQACPPGSVFSISRQMCLAEDKVNANDHAVCMQEYSTTDINVHYDFVVCPALAMGYFIYPFDGLLFIKCHAGHTMIESCEPNTFFSITNKICIPTSGVGSSDRVWLNTGEQRVSDSYGAYNHNREWSLVDTAEVATPTQSFVPSPQYNPECPSSATGLYPHPSDCTKFLRCANGITHIMDCGPGTAFNIALEVCDFIDKVDCTGRVAGYNNEAAGFDGDVQSESVACPEGASGMFSHPLDCTKFLNCNNGITNVQDCGPGTAWNAKLEVCDFIKNVDCSKNSGRNPNAPTAQGGHEHNPNTNYQSPPLPQTNYGDQLQNNWNYRGEQQSYGSSTQHRPSHGRQNYGDNLPTTSTRTPKYGDRWSNMDMQRPIPSEQTYDGRYNPDYERQQRLPNYGKELLPNRGANSWVGTGSAIDRQTPTQSIIYEEGSLQPNREQHSLTTIPIQNTTHETRTEFYSKNTKQESKPNTNWHNHGHSREFHRNHPNLLNPFNEDERPSPHTHHRHKHNRAYHQRHPELPNPFENPEAPTTKTNYDLSNTNLLNPYAESTTPFSVRPPQIDLRVGNVDCPFDCGNGKCVRSHEVCNGINNCGNRKDEDECKHLGYEVRLTGGDNPNMGRVEVKILGKWGYVCDDKFGLRDAEVVCRELGFNLGASEVRGFSYYPPTTADVSFAMDEVECRGNETSLRECDFKGWGVSNCGPDEVVGVVCKVPQLRCPNNYWLCSTSQECIPPAFVCDNTPDCADKSDESESVCNSPIKYRLQGGRSPSEGRLEVRYRGEWGSVCDDDFGIKEAQVMCNSMGFYGTPTLAKNTYGPGSGPIWLDQVSCFGNETTLDQCNHWTWGEHNCNHTEDVGLKCTVGALPRKVTATQQSDESTQQELDETQQQLEDIGLFSEQWERKSKAVGEHRRCGQFKDILIDEYAHPEERVVNGSVAKRGHHPWQATIRTRGRGGISSHWCGAVLISSRHLLTAAHCLAGYPKGAYLVRMGDHYANIAESSEVDSFIENWYVHEKFRDATHMNNDIAVVVLKTPVKFNDYIQPVCLPNKGAALAENRMCTISGWGSIKSGVSTPSNILRAAELPILSDEVCRQKHVYGGSMTEGMFCAGYMDESVDACDGDSGGPLICHDDDGETLYGIISWGQHCGYANKPGVYVRVEKYVDWILEKIKFSMQKGS
ncbi:uncharacterized protein LOC101463243 isoform X5 [Ceratitis capitata]|uniref:uncharacterized protein LOC101463243 isoform X5 n=1 Tax=Ceratitis capitata TaxID=7213 RepID=UPI000A1073FA|nr:uncharacterized protein LOC101463243 isoform X5 [Ceratitis capitata]